MHWCSDRNPNLGLDVSGIHTTLQTTAAVTPGEKTIVIIRSVILISYCFATFPSIFPESLKYVCARRCDYKVRMFCGMFLGEPRSATGPVNPPWNGDKHSVQFFPQTPV